MEPMQPIKGQFQSRDVNNNFSSNGNSNSVREKHEQTRDTGGFFDRLLSGDDKGGRARLNSERAKAGDNRERPKETAGLRRPGARGAQAGRGISRGMAVKLAVCMTTLLLCVAVKLSDAEIAKKTSQLMQNALTYDVDVEESLGQLKFVQRLFPGVATVFSGSDGMRYPVDGNITKAFEELGTGIEITGGAGAKVVAAMDGRVEKRGKNAEMGNYLRIKHSGSMDTYYFGLKRSSLNEGDSVTRGQEIAELGDDGVMVFEVHVRGTAKNPMEYLGKN